MPLRVPLRYVVCVVLVSLVLVGWCSTTVNTSAPQPAANCGFGVSARSWVDADADGTWDDTEAPLAGVTLVVLGDQRSQPSDAIGQSFVGGNGGCASWEAAASAEPPPGFTPTTPQPVLVPQPPK
jgi:hypothetical protein